LEKEVRYIEGLDSIVYELHKIGTNINQIAVAANQGRNVSSTMEAIKNRMLQILDAIDRAIGGDSDSDNQND